MALKTVSRNFQGSTVYNSCEKGGVGLFEEKICKIIDSYENVDMMLAGDFSSRTDLQYIGSTLKSVARSL